MSENQVVIYSNGIADFRRCYEINSESPRRISIPVRQDHLADVLASFNVYGKVKLEAPPTFRPSNELEGNITIDPESVLEDLAKSLSGARVRIDRGGNSVEGSLVGLHNEEEVTGGDPAHPKALVILADDGLRRYMLRDIQAFQFLDEDVQAEIDKALQRNYQRIKPNSTFVELVLSTSEATSEAIVQYTIPAAAWKISYRLRMAKGRPTELQGFAIVDNNTDEDWTDFHVCVVTGEPITFSTDLAESKSPARKHVDLVSEMALGSVEVDAATGIEPALLAAESEAFDEVSARAIISQSYQSIMGSVEQEAAQMATAEVHEVGDFCIFESEATVSIPAKRSTVIPVFNVDVAEAKSVLHYKHENHPERPYRSVDFSNQTGFSLGRGVCTVFENSVYAGSCIIPALKAEESRLLPHALETGVRVRRDQKRPRTKVVALRLSDGFCYTSTRQRRECHYHLKNTRDQAYDLVLDHDYTLVEPDIEATLVQDGSSEPLQTASTLDGGMRYSLVVGPKAQILVKVVEQRIDRSKVELIHVTRRQEKLQIDWLEQNLVDTNGPLALNEGVRECLDIHREAEAKRQEIADAANEIERLTGRQNRLRENIKAGGQDELSSRWRCELDEAEQAIREIEENRLPGLRDEERSLQSRLREALMSLSAEWSEDVK